MTFTIHDIQAARRGILAQAHVEQDDARKDQYRELAARFSLLAERMVGAAIEARTIPLEAEKLSDFTLSHGVEFMEMVEDDA